MSKSKHYRDYDEDKFERRARRSMRNNQQQDESDWKFDPRKNYLRDEDSEEYREIQRRR